MEATVQPLMSSRLPLLTSMLAACLVAGLPLRAGETRQAEADANQVCAQISAFPDAADPERFLSRLGTSRAGVVRDLGRLRRNLEQADAEGYGWQNVLGGPSFPEPRPGAWLLGALRMACEPQPKGMIRGTVSYRQRIALPPDARVVVTLEDVSRADAPATVLAEQTIDAAGRNVPIPYQLSFDPGRIESRHRYVVRAKIFQNDRLIWTSMTAHPVMPLENPTDLEITVERVRR